MITTETGQERPPLRERKKAEARSALTAAAIELFAARGFSSVTVDEIADRAGISRRTFFRYFATKEDVMFDRRLSQLEAFRSMLAGAPKAAPPTLVLRNAFDALARDYQEHKQQVLAERTLFASARELMVRDLEIDRDFEHAIADAVAERSGKSAANVRAARFFAAAAMAVVRVVIDEWAESKGKLDLLSVGLPAFDKLEPLAPSARRPQ